MLLSYANKIAKLLAEAQTSMIAFLPEIDSYFRVSPNFRLAYDAKGYMEDGDLNRAQIGPSLQFKHAALEKLKQITIQDMDGAAWTN